MASTDRTAEPHPWLEEQTIANLRTELASGALSSEDLTRMYLERIEAIDRSGPRLRSVIEIESRRAGDRRALDGERRRPGRAARCTASRSCSRTTSTPPTRCRPPPARSPWSARSRRRTPPSPPGCARPARSCSARPT